MSELCQPSNNKIEKQKSKMQDLAYKWAAKYPNISKRFGGDFDAIETGIKTMAETWLEIPYRESYPMSDFQWNKLEQHTADYNKRLGKNWKASIVPQQTSLNDPIARKFFEGLDNITNYERNQLSINHQGTLKTTSYLREAFIEDGISNGIIGIKTVNRIRDFQNKILKTDDESSRLQYQEKIQEIVNGNEGKILRDFTHLNSLSDNQFDIVKKFGEYKDPSLTDGDSPVYIKVNDNTLRSVDSSRDHLKKLGKVALDGIDQMKRLIDTKYEYIQGDKNSASYKNFISKFDDAKKRILQNRKIGGYMPTMFVESLIDMKLKVEDFMGNPDIFQVDDKINLLSDALSSINLERMPDQFKPKNELIKNSYNQDPLYVIDEYGKMVTAFNKMNILQRTYLEALKNIPDSDLPFIKGMRQFIQEEFYIAKDGLSDRPAAFNKIGGQLSAMLTASTMGLNPTGAIKNSTSLVYYFAEQGLSGVRKARKLLKEDSDVGEAITLVQEEQGFLFPDATLDLVAEGMIPENTNKSDISFNPETGQIEIKGKSLVDFDNVTRWGVDKLLVMHKMTENFTRKFLFNTAFALKYKQLIDNPTYITGLTDGQSKATKADARKFAKNFAINTVNIHAYEYALHSKPSILRGSMYKVDDVGNKSLYANNKFIAGLKGLSQQHGMSLMMYPMSLVGTHIRKFKGAKNELKASQNLGRDFKDMKDVHFFLNYAGAYAMVNLASIAWNIDFGNLIDFDTINRLKELDKNLHLNLITDEDDKDSKENLYGILGQFTGAGIGKLTYLLQTQNIINTGENEMHRILFGNVDYDDPEKENMKYYQYSTAAGNAVNKYWPSFKNGEGMGTFRHLFRAYPTKFTKKWNEKFLTEMLGVKRAPKKKRTKPYSQKELLNKRALLAIEAIYGKGSN